VPPVSEKLLTAKARKLVDHALPWQEWLHLKFREVCQFPFADRHKRLWGWIEELTPGTRPRPHLEVWPRGGAKSTTVELACARLCAKLSRRFVLYVSSTQEKADSHVQSIASLLESLGVERAVNQYGNSKGWKRNQLRTANGFNVAAFGLDTGMRGVKIDQFRPDLIVLDDIDELNDSAKTVAKKISTITNSVLPSGSPDCAILGVQNLIHDEGVFTRLWEKRADFLNDREMPDPEPAVVGLAVEAVAQPDGSRRWKIVAGVPTWEGQNLAVCEQQINDFGLKAFLREAQHEVNDGDGIFFRVSELHSVSPADVPYIMAVCLAWDLAATEGAGDHTVGYLLGKAVNNTYYVLAVVSGQWSSDRVRRVMMLACEHYLPQYHRKHLHIPQDPAQAGLDQAQQMQRQFQKFSPTIETVNGDKATRARGQQEEINKGNFYLVEQDLPELFEGYVESLSWVVWHDALKREYRKFREDLTHDADDIVDSGSDAFMELVTARPALQASMIRTG
jgi:phage terminase large subunit-like protein